MDLRTTFKHTDILPFYVGGCSASFSKDGTILATAVLEDIVITNASTNEVIHQLEGDGEVVTTLQLTPDGRFLGIVSQSQQLRIFNLEKSRFEKSFKLSSPSYISSADPTSTLFAFGASDGSVTVFDIENGYVTHSLKGHGATVCSLSFHGQSGSSKWLLASGDTMGSARVWDLVKRKCLHTMREHTAAVRGVGFSHDGSLFVTAGRDNVAILWNTSNWKSSKTWSAKHQVESAGFLVLEGSEYVFTAGGDCVMKVWDFETDSLVASTKPPLETSEELLIVDVVVKDTCIALVLSDQTICDVSLTKNLAVVRTLAGNHGTIADIRYCHDKLVLATNTPSLRVVDMKHRLEMDVYEAHRDLLNCVDVNEGWIATGSKDKDARLWRMDESGKLHCVAVFTGHAGSVTGVALSRMPIEKYPRFLLTVSSDLTVKKWRVPKLESGMEPVVVKTSEYTRRAHEKDINGLDVSPNDQMFATCSYDKTGKVWDLQTGETLGVLKGHRRGLWDIRFCGYDKLVATGSGDKTAKVWSLEDFTCKKTFEGHTNAIQRVFFINKQRQILTAGADGLVKVWDNSTAECVKTLDNHDNRIWAMCLKDDGLEFITADADGAITMWQDNSEETIALELAKNKEKVEQEQSLQNYINKGDFVNGFLLALKLDHPMRLYKVITSSISANKDSLSSVGSLSLEDCIASLADDQIMVLMKRLRDWNTNGRYFEIAQRVLKVILTRIDIEKLAEVKGLMKVVDTMIPYSERHYTRIDDLVEQSYVLDYVVEEMDKLVV